MVPQGVAVLDQGGVQVAQLGLEGLLVAHDRPDQLAFELQRRCVAGELEQGGVQPQGVQLGGDLAQAGTPVPHHQDGLALIDEGTDGVDGCLGLAGARRAADHERVPGADGVDDVLLVGVGVEQEQFIGGIALVGVGEAPGLELGNVHRSAGGSAAQRRHEGMVPVDPRVVEAPGQVGEGGDQEVVFDLGAVDRLDEGAKAVEDRLRIKPGGAVSHAGDGVDVEDDPVDGLQVPDQRRVDLGLFGQLQFVVVLALPDRQGDGGQHNGGGDPLGFASDGGGPDDRARGEVARVDAAVVGEFEDLGAQVAGGPRGDDVLLVVTDQGGEPGAPAGHQLRQAGGMGVGQVDGAFRRLGEAQHGVCSGDGFEPRQPFPELLGALGVALTN